MINSLYDNFQHWSNTGAIYIISDLHFGDSDCKLMNKNWIVPEEQIKIINKYANKNDTFICLGDVGDVNYISQLKAGYKILIMGNHDTPKVKFKNIFDEVYDGPLFISDKILLSHEPIYGLDFCVNIHGHNHNPNYKKDSFHLNLAANICNYTPINLGKEIKNGLMSNIKNIHRQTIDKRLDKGI